jgi:hypothetical protein
LSRPLQIIPILLIILLAAFVRVADLSRLPAGFMDEEIVNLRISETIRAGSIGVFYDVKTPDFAGRESFFPLLVTVLAGTVGNGLLGLRLLPLFCGLVSVTLMFILAKRLFGFAAGVLAALLCTFGLYPVLLSRLVIPQTLLLPLYLGAFVALTKGLHLHTRLRPALPKSADFGILAICAAFSFYTHFTGLMLFPIITIFMIYLRRTNQPLSKYLFRAEVFAGLLAIILCLPYLLSSIRVPGLSGIGAYWGYRPESFWALFTHLFELLRSLLNYGGMDTIPGLGLIFGLGGLLVLGIITAARGWHDPRHMLALLMLFGGLFPAWWMGRGDYNLTIAIPGAILLLTIGALRVPELLTRNGARQMAIRRVAWLTPLIAIVTGAGLYTELFVRWPQNPDINRQFHGYLGNLAVFLDTTRDNIPTLICADNLRGSPEQPVSDPVLMDFMLHRTDANLRFSDCSSAIVLADGGKRQRVAYNFDSQGETPVVLREWLRQLNSKPIEIKGINRAGVWEVEGESQLAAALGKITLSYATWPPDLPNADDAVKLPVRMGDNLTFEGYSLGETRTFKPGDNIVITTYWRIDGTQRDDLRLFTHLLLDPGSAPTAQNDLLDAASNFLRPRDILIQTSVIQIPYPFPEGTYYLSVGAYHFKVNERVPFFDGQDQIRGNRLFLGTIEIKG